MKKILAILLTAILVLSLATAALAEDYTDAPTVTITKVYKLEGAGESPAETFTVQQTAKAVKDGDATTAPDLGAITGAVFEKGAATAAGATAAITITLPTYEHVGIYEYTLKEIADTTAGVTYFDGSIKLVVTVVNGEDGTLRVAGVHTETEGEKSDEIVNTYSAGSLKVSKTVTGNLGDKTKFFKFTVSLTGVEGKTYGTAYKVAGGSNEANPETIAIGTPATFYLKHGETITIENLPYGVTYTVEEEAVEDYGTTAVNEEGTIAAAEQTASFTNNKDGIVDTGVLLDTLPYVLILAMVLVFGTALLLKRKAR